MDGETGLTKLVGRTITSIAMNDEYLRFDTDQGTLTFTVEGDCCSHSYFHDFMGVEKLLKNGPVISIAAVSLDVEVAEDRSDDYIAAYGFEVVIEDPVFGPVTAVFSFRNASNGYYGGWMEECGEFKGELPVLTEDLVRS
jgi:hypothetical protein